MLQNIQFDSYPFRYEMRANGKHIYDIIRKKFVLLTKEEWVRQNLIHYFIQTQNYPKGLISVEREILINNLKKRYDIVVYNQDLNPWMLIECKEPDVPINEVTLKQLLQYHQVLQSPYWLLSNGWQHYCAKVENGNVQWLDALPEY